MKAESLYIQKLTYDENTGNEIIGLFPSEANPAIVSSYTYDAKRMGGAPTLTATIYSSEPLQWKKEEFVEFNGDRFFASYTPNSTKDNTSRMWKSEITFTSRRELLDNTLFFDVVVDDVDTQNKDRYRSNQTKFTFGGTIHEFVARINSSMAYCGLYRPTEEYKGYYVVVDEGYGTDEVKEVSFEDQYLTDVLQLVNTTFELDYYWDGNVCHVGKVQHDLTDTPIKYGSSDALISVSKENANYKIVDMITGYGSSDNLPYYYPNDDEFGEAVFNTENISKDKVSVDLSKFLKGSKYNDVLVLYKSKYGQKYSASIDSSLFGLTRNTEPENLTLADNQTNPTVTCSFGFSFYVKLIKGQILDFTKLSFKFSMLDSLTHKDNITEITAAYKDIYLSNGNDIINITKKTVFGDNCKYPCENDGEYKLTIWAEFSYRCRVFINGNGVTDYYGANSWNASFIGNIELLYEPTSEYEWKNGDKYIPYDESGINIREISGANCIEYDYQFFKDDNRYGFNKVYTGTEDNAVKVMVTDRVWIAPSSVLMPSIYRNTKGAERFYYALNNTHKLPSGSGYYEFVNLYKKGNPHQGTVTFDDIKPTINGIVNAEGQLFGEIADVAFDKEDSDVKDSDGNYIHSYFYIKLHKFNGDFGFDLFAHALASESAKINLIKSNGCPACSFVIYKKPSADNSKYYNCVSVDENGNLKQVRTDKNDYIFANASDAYEDNLNQDSTQKELWIAVQKDTSTLGIVMPNASAGFKPQKGDLFVITGIKPPKVLVTAAEKRLDDALVKHMSENNTDQFNYSVKFSRIFLQENPDFASKLNENAKLSIQIQGDSDSDGNLISHEVFVSNYSVKVDNDELAEVEIELVNSLEVTKSDTKQIIDAVKGEAVKSLSSMVGGSNTNSFNASITDKMYLSKLNDDTAKGTITWEKIQKLLSGLLVGNSNSENGGSWTPDTEGRSHLITDYLEVRMKAIFEELVVKKTSTIGGKEIVSPAGGVVAHKVEEVTVTYNNVSQKAYRCYFLAEQEGDAVDNDFAIGDQVRSESFNVRKGTYHKVGNHFYWRLVIGRDEEPVELEGKKYHYIDLSDTDCATASDVPAKGDVLSQCGNRTDVDRQNCLIFSAVDTYSPSVSLYHGINSYSFANREYVEYGVNKQTNKAFFNVYGDMYVGDRPTKDNGYEGSSYVKYDSATKQVVIKGKLSAKSTVDGKELSQYIKENSAKGLTEEQVNNIINNSQVIADLQNQVDGAIETWFYDGVPTLTNAPASSWTTNKDKDTHLGDLYYDNKTGKAYRFAKDGNTYKWTIITDTDIAKALADASKAQETADGKMKVFSSQPTPPYQVGDIWVNATYPSDGSTYKNEVLRCQTDKKAGSQFAIADWIKASKYTDDTVANAAKKAAEEAKKAAETAQTNITNLGKTVTINKKAFDSYVKDGYLEPSEIAAMAQDSKRLEDDFAAAEKSYNEVKGAEVLKSTKELTDLNTAFATLTTAKTELVTYLSDISSRYNAADTNGKATIVSAVGTKFTNFQSAYSAFYDKLGLANAYITSKIYGDLKQNITDLAGYKYIKDALGQTTDIDGGLVMTTLLALRDADGNVQSGINGAIDTNRGKKSIATWWGGQMVDKDYNSGSLTPATSLVRFDGSGYLANGAIWWDVDGKVHADPTSFIISEKNLGAYLAFFEPTWKSGSNGTNIKDLVALTPQAPFTTLSVSNDLLVEGKLKLGSITLSVVNGALKIDGNVYSTGGMSAYGDGTNNGGGGGLVASVKSYTDIIKGTYTDNDLASIPNAYAIKALSNRIDNISSELGGLSLDWANITGKPSTFTPSAHTHKWVDITDRITKVSQLTNDSGYTTNKGTVTSVKLTLPTGLSLGTTKEITTSGTFAISLTSGYSIPTTSKQGQWDSAYNWYKLMTTDEETADGVINKWNEVVDFLAGIAQTDSLDSILSGINKSITDETNRAKKAEGANATNIATNKANITTLQGYFTNGSAKSAMKLTNARKLWGNSFDGTADISGSIVVPSGKYISIGNIKMEYDAANKALKITNTTTNEVANLYTSGGVSAYGVGTSSSSGGGLNGSVKSYSDALKLTSESLSEVASAYSIKALDSRISSLEGGSATAISVSGSGNAVTSVTKNGTTISIVKGSTFLTNHQSLDGYVNAISVSGSGNAITSVSKSGKGITFTKGATFLTSHQSLANYYTKSSVDSLLSGKSATSHTHSVKINGITKTIAASGGDAVDLGTYLTAHQSLAAYATQNWVKNEATAHNADMVDNYHASGLFTGFSISDVANKVTISIGGTSKALNLVRAFPSGVGNNFNDIATHGNSMGMSDIAAPYASSTANYQTLNGYVNPNGQTGWHHYINLSYTDSNNTATSPNMWQTQFAIKAGTTEVYVRSRAGGKISNDAAWAAPWVRLARVTDNVASASKVANALSWSGYSSGSYNGSAVKSISIPNNTNQLTNGAGFITSSASITGNAGSATKLQNARTINGTSFNGTANIVTSYWGTTRKLWGNSVNGNADVNGSITIANTDGVYVQIGDVRLVYDKANTAIKVVKSDGTTAANFYATGGMSAYGDGTNNGGGGGLVASVKSYTDIIKGTYTDNDLASIPNAYAIKALSNRIDNISSELGGLSLDWANITGKPSTFTPSAHTHKWVDITDRITKVSQLTNDSGYTTNKGTVTSVKLTLPTGLSLGTTKEITTSGTFAISLTSGYSIPTTSKQGQWDSAYNWYKLMTTDEETADGVINKWNEVVDFLAGIAQTDSLDSILSGINKSITDETNRAKKAEGANATNIATNKANITTLQGYFTNGSAKSAMKLTNARKLWGNSFDGTADISGSIVVPSGKYISIGNIKMEYDAANKALKITNTTTNEVANLYTSGGVSAYGVGTSSSSGGGLNGSVKSYSDALKLTSESLSEVASAYSIKALDSRISSLEGGSATAISVSGSGNAVTSVTKNGTTISIVKGSTFLTNHQSLDGYVNAISVSGSGNAITSVSKSGKGITFTKGATFLTSHQSLANYYTKSSVDSLLSGKSATSHTHSVKINGITKTIAASGGDAVDLGTYLTAHQSLAAYATQNWVKNEATAHNADMVDNYHASGLFTGFSISDVANKVTISIGGTSKALNLVRAFPSGVGNNFNDIATHGNSMGMSDIAAPYASSTANYQTLNGYVNPNGQTGWHHYINLSYTDSNNTATSPNMWQTQFAIKAGTTEVYVRSRAGGKISNDAAWAAPWVRLARVTDNVASASKVANALSWSGYSSGSYNGSAVKSISIPNNTNQLTNGAGFITSSASITGNAGSATKLQNARTINGTSFNGTANIVTSYWGTTRKLWGNSVNGNADVNGSITIANTDGVYVQIGDVRLVYDKANTAIKVVKSDGTTAANFYATGGISAYGTSSAGSGGGLSGSVLAWDSAIKMPNATNGSSDTTKTESSFLASAWSIKQLYNKVTSLEGGSAMNVSMSGSGNAVTSISKSGTTISVVKGSTFLTAHQSLAGYMKTATADAKYMYHSRNNIVSDLNSFATNGAAHIYEMNNVTNRPNSNSWVQVMNWGTGDSNYGFLLANDYSADGHMYFRQKIAGSWKSWKTIIDSSNIGSQSVNYAASAGSVAWTNVSGRPSTMKNPSALSWSGYSSGSYDGSAAKSISIPNNTNQLRNGAGFITASASITGNAATATKLVTARNIALGHDFRGSANFDGSGNITINGHINSASINLGSTDPNPFKRIAHVQTANSWNDNALLLYLSQGYIGGNVGICRVEFRTDNVTETGSANVNVRWLVRYGYVSDSVQVGYYSAKGNSYMDVFVKTTGGYQGTVIRCLQDSRGGINSYVSLFAATQTTEAYTSIEAAAKALYNLAYTSIVKGSDVGTVNYANSAGNSYTLDGIHANGLFTNLSNSGNNLSITIGGTNKTLTVKYASNAGNADTLDGVHASGLFTNLSNSGNNISITIGGTNKTLTAAYATNCDTVDGYHAQLGSSKPYGKIPVIGTDGVIELGHYIDFHHDNTTGSDYSVRLQTNGNHSNVVTLPTATGTLALTSDNVASATKLQTTRTLWGQSFNGTANISGSMTGVGDMTLDAGARIKHGSGNLYIGNSDNSNWIGVQDICSQSSIGDGNWSLRTSGAAHFKDTTINGTATIKNLLSLVDGSHKGLKMGSTYISSLDGEVILQGNTALRFGNDAWDYNQWAGLKYDHSIKTVYLGIADGSIFKANSAQSGGVINLKQGISSVYTPALYAGGDIYHTGVYRMLWKNSKASTYLNVMNISQDDNGILTIGYGNFSNNKNVVLEGYNLNFRVGNDSGMKSMWLNYNNGNPVLSLDGNFYATGGVTAYKSSDERLKHDIHGVDSLAIIKAMGGTVAFRYNADNKDSIGWIAQRVLHNTFMQDLVEKDDKGFLKINYWSPKLIAVAFGAIEQVDDEVIRLKRRVRDLENEVEQLKSDRL